MNSVAEEDEYDDFGPSLAIPPLYVLRTTTRCPQCGQGTRVYALGCTAYHDADDSRPVTVFHFLHHIQELPEHVLATITSKCPGYRFDGTNGERYLTNHCACGAVLDDELLHGDVGVPFWPDTPEGFEQFHLSRLPVHDPIAIESSYTIGGGEYLAIEKADVWEPDKSKPA